MNFITFLETIDLWDIFLPLILVFAGLIFTQYTRNKQIKIFSLIASLAGLFRLLFVFELISFLWWQYACFAFLVVSFALLCVVKFSSPVPAGK